MINTAPQQQPKENCDHECVCRYRKENEIPCLRNYDGIRSCASDTRSRPHPAPAQIKLRMPEDLDVFWLRGHDAAIRAEAARQAREDVLTKTIPFFEEDLLQGLEYIRQTDGDDNDCVPFNEVLKMVEGKLKTLRELVVKK